MTMNSPARHRGKNVAAKSFDEVHLQFNESADIFQEKNVAHLLAVPTDIFQGQFEIVGNGPPHDPALVQFGKLASAGDDAKAIDDDRHVKGLGVLLAGGVSDQSEA